MTMSTEHDEHLRRSVLRSGRTDIYIYIQNIGLDA